MPMKWIGPTAALALALLAQQRLAHSAPPLEVGALFLIAVGLAIRYFPIWEAEVSRIDGSGHPAPCTQEGESPYIGAEPREESSPTAQKSTQRIRRGLLVTAWLAQAVVLILAADEVGWPWDGLLWGLSLLAFLGALVDRDWWQGLQPFTWQEILTLGMVLGLAIFARVYNLGHLPPAIHGDEAQFGLNARTILHGKQPTLFAVGWYQFPIASFAAQAGIMRLFGDDIAGLRLSSALFGALTLLPVYLLARSMFDRRVALASAALMAVGHWSVHFSRLGINNIQATFFAAWAVYLVWRALRTQHRLDYALTGLALGLGLYAYYAARLMPLIVGGVIGLAVWRNRGQWRHYVPGLLALVIAGTLTIAPQVVYFAKHPEPLVSRQRGVFLFNNLPHLESAYHTDDWGEILRQQAIRSLLVFNARGDSSGQYGFDEPMLDKLTAGLLVVGLGLSLWRLPQGGHWVLHVWFWPHLLLGSMLTVDAPFVPRLAVLMPVPFIWAGVALGGWWRPMAERLQSIFSGKALRELLALIPAFALLALVGWNNYDAYVNRYIRQRRPTLDSTQAAHLMANLPTSTQVYLMGTPNIYAGFGTFRFEAPNAKVWDVVNVTDWVPLRQSDPPDALFLLWPSHLDRLPYLRNVYPDGDYQSYPDQSGTLMFATYFVPAQVIRQRQGLVSRIVPAGQLEEGSLEPADPANPHPHSPQGDIHKNVAWHGTLWLPEDGPRQFCLPYAPEQGSGGAHLQIDSTRIDIPGADKSCDGLALALDLPAGPHPIEARITLPGGGETLQLYWRLEGEAWEAVPRYLLWDEVWSGGLLGVFEQEGTLLRREITPLIAYRDFTRKLAGSVQAVWTGCLATDKLGEYEFRVRSFDRARLMLDGQLLIDDDHHKTLGEGVAHVVLGAGGHSVRLETLFTDGPRWLEWYWRPLGSGSEWALVPPEVLVPDPSCAQ
jgi:4-amino-4-deoxy-L-arabinose transferase-like glycosyltransferase